MKKVLLFGLLIILTNAAISQAPSKEKCSIVREGTFKYLGDHDTTVHFVISNESHVEYFQSGAYTVKSKVTWIDSCTYTMLMLSNTVPDVPFKPGQTMTVIIDKIEDGVFYFTSKIQDYQWQGRFIKVK